MNLFRVKCQQTNFSFHLTLPPAPFLRRTRCLDAFIYAETRVQETFLRSRVLLFPEFLRHVNSIADYISVQPDLTQTVVTLQNHHVLDTPNNNLPGSTEKVPVFCDNGTIGRSTHTLLLVDAPSPKKLGGGSSVGERPDAKMSDLEGDSRPQSVYSERTNRQSMLSCQLPNNIDIEDLMWANVTHLGERIVLPEAGELDVCVCVCACVSVCRHFNEI